MEGCSFSLENKVARFKLSDCQNKAQLIYYEFGKINLGKYNFKNLPKLFQDFGIIWTKLPEITRYFNFNDPLAIRAKNGLRVALPLYFSSIQNITMREYIKV